MPHQFTRKHWRDRTMFAHWDNLGDEVFERISRDQLKAVQAGLQGYIVLPDDPEYNKDRQLSNPVFNKYPIVIIYCFVEEDVEIALLLARELPLPFTVRSGGHCTAGFSASYGALIDVSHLDDAVIDPVAQIATVGTGCPFSTFDLALDRYGLHVPGGECGDVCVGGYVQGGGYGFTSVTYGMNCDNVIDMRVMLADGRVVTASESVNSDLWWAMRGGTGGNFGILLSVRYQLVPISDVFGWALIWALETPADLENATGALMALQSQYMLGQLNPQLTIQVSLCYQPGEIAGLPPATPLKPYLMVRGVFVGSQSDGQDAIEPLCELPGAYLQWSKMDSFYNLNNELLNVPYGMPCFPSDMTVMPCEDKASRYVTRALASLEWLGLLQYFVTSPNTWSYFYMEFYGGAINSYSKQGNAFVHRDAAFNAVLDVFWFDEADRPASEAFLLGWMDVMAPMWNGEIYQNYPRLDEPNYAVRYWADAHAGLCAVKAKYDPEHAFTFPQEVGPLMPGPAPGPVIILPPWLRAMVDRPIVCG